MLGLWTGAAGGSSSDTERLVLFQLPSMLPAPPPVRAAGIRIVSGVRDWSDADSLPRRIPLTLVMASSARSSACSARRGCGCIQDASRMQTGCIQDANACLFRSQILMTH